MPQHAFPDQLDVVPGWSICLVIKYPVAAEGIFRINVDNGQEEFVRNQLNVGVVPVGIDVHCLAGLIKIVGRILNSMQALHGHAFIEDHLEHLVMALTEALALVGPIKCYPSS
ncbi:hypothetical protein POM88_025478 [Heracleum sosnowskyi]|uniref:Uncharacterized protein n=1 Tax=Heracleum sosnowskyi TaxID=360622 RepID=A0AAD8I5C3_9APIA|nr:hypothetical protein POM88_025478 [Heracleum sosnowskyi]